MQTPSPSVESKDFACPHCGAHAHQLWYETRANFLTDEQGKPSLPFVPRQEHVDHFDEERQSRGNSQEARERFDHVYQHASRMIEGLPFLGPELPYNTSRGLPLNNVWVSRCHACSELALWVYDALIYPPARTGPLPNADLPTDALRDYEEASSILALSPRGAAALLRLTIEKLCRHIGAQGDDLNKMIGWLVANGLPVKIQQALDTVRVIGNEAVHPGTLDLRDDGATAAKLFELVNIIADAMISQPKRVEKLFDKIPPKKKAGIFERDAKKP
jgi:hypothetical protein